MQIPTANNISVSDHWIETAKGRLFARSWQPQNLIDEVPIILFHDSLGCVQMWRDFPKALAEATKRKVIAYDRLGFGKSDKLENKPNIDFIAKEADEFFFHVRECLGFYHFIAFGHSVGGAMAVLCANRFPKECIAVITESAQAFVEDRTLEGISVAKKNFEDPAQFSKIEKYHADKTLWVFNAWTDIWLSPEFSSWSLKEELPKVQCPLLVIHGEKDEYGSLKFPEMISTLASGPSEKLIITECGHVPHREEENKVLEATKNFLDRRIKPKNTVMTEICSA